MCLAVPGRIESIRHERGSRVGRVDFGGVSREVCLEFVPEAVVGDWALVHVGFALTLLDEAAARATLEALESVGLAEPVPEAGGADGPRATLVEGPACPRLPHAGDGPGGTP